MKTKRDFLSIIEMLEESIYTWDWITDFNKCSLNANKYSNDFKIVEEIIESNDFDFEFKKHSIHNKNILKIFISMLCLRNINKTFTSIKFNKDNIMINKKLYDFCNFTNNVEDYLDLIKNTGLLDFLKSIKNIDVQSLLMGIECGMDTNARKNRSGKMMEDIFEMYLIKNNINYHKQKNLEHIDIDDDFRKYILSKNKFKKFDFIVFNNGITYLIEVNFFSDSGSKLDAIANNFKLLSQEINKFEKYKFVWITDGIGWKKTIREFKDAYDCVEYLYTLNDLDKNIFN